MLYMTESYMTKTFSVGAVVEYALDCMSYEINANYMVV